MERCDYKSLKQEYRYRNTTREHPSFSSTLLDAIYRSIDENNNNGETTEQELIFYRETMRKKQINNNQTNSSKEEDMANLKRACLIEKWMEKKKSNNTEKVVVARRKSMADFHRSSNSMMLNSSSSSNSDSSFSGGLSSSEAESIYGVNSNSRSLNFNTIQKPKPIRTSVSSEKYHHNKSNNGHEESYDREVEKVQWHKINHHHESSNSNNNNFVKTKSRALKIYSELKKVKQPISPGGRLASFLNSLFAHGDSKKAKISTTQHHRDTISEKTKSKSAYSSTCSSASSFSRSCLSKTPSSSSRGGKVINGGAKRSVRFYPVDVIVDHEDCRPVGHGHNSLHGDDEFGFMATVKNVRNVDENARNVVMNNYERNTGDLDMKDVDDASDDDDDASCASSDLFELDNLATIGIDRYSEELPVYETTHFGMNRAIAKGLIV